MVVTDAPNPDRRNKEFKKAVARNNIFRITGQPTQDEGRIELKWEKLGVGGEAVKSTAQTESKDEEQDEATVIQIVLEKIYRGRNAKMAKVYRDT